MTNPETQPKSAIDEIKGHYVDISIINPEDFRAYLDTKSAFKILYSSTYARELPRPLFDAHIGYEQFDDTVSISSELHFPPSAIEPATRESWQAIISSSVYETLADNDYTIVTLPHESYAYHVPLSEQYAVHITYTTETHRCSVEMNLERLADIEEELGERIAKVSTDDEGSDTYKLFREFAAIWVNAIDVVVDEYGHQKKKRPLTQIVIETPPSVDPHTLVPQTPTILESSTPEREHTVSARKSFDMLGGLERPKQQLRTILETFNDPVGTKMYGISASHFMLYGPSGTGKTSLVEALAGEIPGAHVQYVASSDIMATLVGQSGINLDAIFTEAFKHTEPYILFFDEFDAIAGKGNNDSVSHIEVKRLLNKRIEDVANDHPNIIIAAATNLDPSQIEDSLIRGGRLMKISTPLPNNEERIDIWAAVLARSYADFNQATTIAVDEDGDIRNNQQFIPYGEDINPPQLAQQTESMTGSDFEQILLIARANCYRHYRQTGEAKRVGQAELLFAIQEFGR